MLYLVVGEKTRVEDLKRVIAPVVRGNAVPHRILRCTDPRPQLGYGDVMFAMGNGALKSLQFFGILPKNKTVGSLRQSPIKLNDGYLCMSYDAGIGNIDYGLEVQLSMDIMQACRLHMTGTVKPELGEYRWVDDFSDTIEYIKAKYAETGKPVKLATDLETVGLDPIDPHRFIVSISFTYHAGQADLKRFAGLHDQPEVSSKLHQQIEWLLTSDMVSLGGANLKYDLGWIWHKWKIHCTNFRLDTTLVGSLLDENRSNSLNTHAKLFTTMGGYDDDLNSTYDKGRMDLIPDDDLLPYAGGDTDATYRVRDVFTQELLRDPELCNFYIKLQHPASRAFEIMEQNGVNVNQHKLENLGYELDAEMEEYEALALDMIPNFIKMKYRSDLKIKASLVSDYLFSKRGLGLKPLMFSEKTGKPKTNHAHLQNFLDESKYPEAARFIKLTEMYNKAAKARSTYVTGFLKHLRSDGRFHPSFILFKGDYGGGDSGTVTGRLAARDPAIQTLPKHSPIAKRLRSCYEPPEGYAIVEVDYSQGELRVCAVVAQEKTMINAYNQGMDLHALTGGSVAGLTYAEMNALKETDPDLYKKYRQGGKPANFGLLYGMSADGYQAYAKDNYGVILTGKQAKDTRNNFFDTYSGLPAWHESCVQQARATGCIRSPLGRIRHLPMIHARDSSLRSQAERQSINSGIQSTLSDMLILAMAEFNKKYGRVDECRFWAMIHDAILCYVKIEHLDYWVATIQEIMENLPLQEYFGWETNVDFLADAEYSTENLASMKEWKAA
ncbi:DNA polymerase I [Vibrio phage vB_VpS_PG28]|nr:DNA polymerase I [Vibrio phage vB_VpS_PG28]